MPIDKRKMVDTPYEQSLLPSRNPSLHTISLFLICCSLLWNAYNTYQYQILHERQMKLENLLAEMSPSLSVIPTTTTSSSSSSSEAWFRKALHFIEQLTSTNKINNNHLVQSNKVRFVFLEMLIESLDTCECVWMHLRMVLVKVIFIDFKHA